MKTWKPSAEELKTIRQYAESRTGRKVCLQPGMRIRLGTDQYSFNVLEVDNTEDWTESDLFSPYSMAEFNKEGTTLVDGRAIIDFYVYARGIYPDLLTNVIATWKDGKLISIEG